MSEDCPICLKELNENIVVSNICECKVKYHEECLNQAYQYNYVCPICRTNKNDIIINVAQINPNEENNENENRLIRIYEIFTNFLKILIKALFLSILILFLVYGFSHII